MPTVPNISASMSGEPGARVDTDGAAALAQQQGRAAAESGQVLSQLGQVASSVYIDRQQEANQLRVDDAINRLKEQQLTLTFDKDTGFTTQKGIAALERPSGRSLTDEYSGELDKTISTLASGLGNDAQRRAFSAAATGLRSQFAGQLTQHETDEYRGWAVSVRDGTIGIRVNEMGTRWNDPTFDRKEAALSIRAAVADKGRMLGWSANEIEVKTLALTSAGHKTALLAAMESGNVAFADGYLKQYSEQMTADDLLSVKGQITKEMDATLALSAVEDVYQQAQPQLNATDADRAFYLATGKESGSGPGTAPNQFDAKGRPLTSYMGAVGAAQVMPGTGPEAAKLAGLPWDPERLKTDKDYNLKLGKAYFDNQLRTFGGDVRKAWAAYNAGPRWVKAAQERAAKAAPGTEQADWFWQLNNDGRTPKNREQTKDYVEKLSAAFGAGAGAPARPSLEDVVAQIRRDPRLAGNPGRIRLAEDEARRRWTLAEGERKQREAEALDGALRALVANGGDYMSLPASTRMALAPTQIDTVVNFAKTLGGGQDVKTDMAAYMQLTNPAYLKSLTDEQFYAYRAVLSDADFKHFANDRVKPPGGGKDKDPGALDTPGINAVLADRLRQLEIDPTPKDGGEEAARIGTIRKYVRDSVITAQQAAGRPFTRAELEAHIDGLFNKSFVFDEQVLGFKTGQDIVTPMMTMDIGDIPAKSTKDIRAAFAARGIKNPTDWQIVGAYWRSKGTR